jgi:hypothetical protein
VVAVADQIRKTGGVRVMQRTYFTREEARREIGRTVEAVADFPSVPKGSRGSVVKIQRYTGDKWLICVKWHLPRAISLVDAMVGDASLNFFVRRKATTDQFCKSEYETLLRVLAPAQNVLSAEGN